MNTNRRDMDGNTLVPGYNVDRIDVEAGIIELMYCGYNPSEWQTFHVIEYSLMLWARGEEESAERKAIDRSFFGIDFTSWRRVLASARAYAEMEAEHAG